MVGMAYGVLTTLPPVHGKGGISRCSRFLLRSISGLYVSFFPVIVYMIFGTCPHLSIGEPDGVRISSWERDASVGTFAVISIMTAQAIDGVSPPAMGLMDANNSSTIESNLTDSSVDSEKLAVATTLALLVGFVQVKPEQYDRARDYLAFSLSYCFRFCGLVS